MQGGKSNKHGAAPAGRFFKLNICSNLSLVKLRLSHSCFLELDKLDKDLQQFRLQNILSGEYDSFPCRLVVLSGAGGLESQDWAEMLLRMYVRWAERQPDFSVRVVDRNEGEEGGVRSAEIEVRGDNAYGLLAGEKGTHRLVRISPFNAQGKRQCRT